ncbi:transcriptional regulator, PadR-like family [Cellulomonas flavigena DSM 20109]|uniref:Transcriptional regulator, PadR-like family n=1 Tax=Cellulomonas flavigena (strain ATCC 482 / DSM 20109 / BCRC 11376 / JCM 18109 / NBRC 3775 / NCIMB 8073 / NRS 134) TaxID=446466 RepID=D5ULR8_CELFN|nr:PadR family transcriptional regulator [Cellulomonas flavigena]ADG76024.1 transcriptional regulator, PadR-like family [Cellulomonas flavigena DSM 20109]
MATKQLVDADTAWPGDWLRGVLSLCALRVLADGPTYGYDIAQRLAAAGLGEIKGGTLYPLLGRLAVAGLLDEEWRPGDGGPGRKYYALTPAGRTHLRDESARWSRFADLTQTFVTSPEADR